MHAAVCDQLSVAGIELAAPSEATLAEIAKSGIDVKPGVMIDLTLAGARYETVRSAVEAMARAPDCDVVVVVPQVDPGLITPHSEAFQAVVWHCLVSHPVLQTAKTKW